MSWIEDSARAIGSPIARTQRTHGGDINDAYLAELEDGRRVFIKTRASAPRTMYAREAAGLRWLSEAGALRVPSVIAHGETFLALEWIESARRARDYDEQLGRGLAALHAFGAPSFGWSDDNFVGSLPQRNESCDSWVSFYGERRLMAQLRLAIESGRASARMKRGMERLVGALPDLVGPAEPPARLHGDLWGGNVHTDEKGEPVLIDPAVYGGHREIDLAMLQLFGGMSARALAAYDEAHPLAAGWRERVTLCQIYPLMVHVNLFGGGYVSSAERAIERYAG